MTKAPKLLVFNSSPDTIDMLVEYFRHHGWEAHGSSAHQARVGAADLIEVIHNVAPDVIVFDVAIPYEGYWRVCHELRSDPRVRVPIVLTTTNALALHRLVPTTERVLEIIGKPYDLQQVLRAVQQACDPDYVEPAVNDAPSTTRERRYAERRVGDRRGGQQPDESAGDAAERLKSVPST